ncbi:MAG: anti-sigma factor domain-containing protein [Acidobacteriota bacterium]
MRNLSEQKFREMIYPFSAGCLDKDECLDFIEYLRSGQKVPENELGELQNVVALMPAILELETPQPHVKDKVAKRLYRMREELREKKKQMVQDLTQEDAHPINENVFAEKVYEKPEEKPALKKTGRMTVETPAFQSEPMGNMSRPLSKSVIVEVPYTDPDKVESEIPETPSAVYRSMDTFQQAAPLKEDAEVVKPERTESIRPKRAKIEPDYEEEEKSERSFRNIMILSSILVFVLIAGGIIYFAMNRELHQGKEQIASLSGQVNALNSEILRLDRNQKVLAVLSAKDLRTINLDGADGNSGGFGKLSILQNGSEGVIQFYNMPQLKDSSVYQLWLKSRDRYYSLGAFRTIREVEYFPFSIPNEAQGKIDSYIVTLESAEGRTTPSDKVYLMTTLSSR